MQHIKPSLCHNIELKKRGFEEELAVAVFTFLLQGFFKIPANQSAGSTSLTTLAKPANRHILKSA